ncbi:hypothetical protein FGADI_11304 [Fusarium gaditjirri]|uniref:BTB domain-containing protein n=1 Tax=Fusarium gaditjirri TaxID=282569 RepID=A0A8H4WPR1_9HYPO|nr:hypothetical protein FGADI_11304 [Fusarium gaditjirri]
MEPVGALASVITIVGLIRPTAKFVKALRGIASENGTVASEIRRMATRIQTSATSIDIALEDLKSHSLTLRQLSVTPSKILRYIIENNSMDIIVSGTESISKQMRDKSQELKHLKKQPKFVTKLKWCIWDKMEVESLFPEMQLIAACLSLVCPIIRLEVNQLMLEKSPGEVARCIRQEMESIRGQLKMVEKQFQTIIQEQHQSISGGSEFEAEFYAMAKPLLRLAKSVRRTGKVPETRRGSPSNISSASEELSLTAVPSEMLPVLGGERIREVPGRARRNPSQRSAISRNLNSAATSQAPRLSSGMRPPKPPNLSVPREVPPELSRHSFSSGESSGQHSAPQSPSPQTPDTPPTPQVPDSLGAPEPLTIDTSGHESETRGGTVQAIQGWIINPQDHGRDIPVTNAKVDRYGSVNYISIKTVKHFDLNMQNMDPDELGHINSGSHEVMMPGPVIAQRNAATMASESAQSKALVDLLKTGDYSDLVISCGKDQYRVHKAIICPRSHFFKAACDGKFKEAQTGTIDLPDDDPIAVRMMIEYLYHDAYVPPAGAGIHRGNDGIDAHLSDTEYNDEHEKRSRELYGATFIGNKRVKRLTVPPTVRASNPPKITSFAAFIASRESRTGSVRSPQERGSTRSTNSASVQSPSQASPDQSSSTPRPSFSSIFTSTAPSPNPAPPPPTPAPQRLIPSANLHLHAKVYALGEKYGIKPLKQLALRKFESEAQYHLHSNDFLQAMREAYTSTVEADRPLRDAVVAILRRNKDLLKKDPLKEVLKETALGFDLLMDFASE